MTDTEIYYPNGQTETATETEYTTMPWIPCVGNSLWNFGHDKGKILFISLNSPDNNIMEILLIKEIDKKLKEY